MNTTKMTLKISISRNYNTVSAEFVEETINYYDESDLQVSIDSKYLQLRQAVERQLEIISPRRSIV